MFSGVEAAISGAAVGAAKSKSEWAGLKAQVAAGSLRTEPGVAEACANACQVAYDGLKDSISNARLLNRVDGLGFWDSGRSITQKFRDKAGTDAHSNNSAVGIVKTHQQVLLEMRDTFRAAGRACAATEQGNVDQLWASGGGRS